MISDYVIWSTSIHIACEVDFAIDDVLLMSFNFFKEQYFASLHNDYTLHFAERSVASCRIQTFVKNNDFCKLQNSLEFEKFCAN